ncbi:SCAN domain-containing protein 3-like [Macrobrachium rosenbergii]|uniref:SCAN domain-containing protein 3-like n=1 Tax=Macrobrachium rosenbergii TaxID=79674 RepID=UPI0034D6EB1F
MVRPLSVSDLNERGQVDLVDMQAMRDGSCRFILHYMEYITNFHVVRSLKSKTAAEVANELLSIFLDTLNVNVKHIQLQTLSSNLLQSKTISQLKNCIQQNGQERELSVVIDNKLYNVSTQHKITASSWC